MWNKEIERLLVKTKANIERFQDGFPIFTQDGVYQFEKGVEWTSGFWVGILWLCYQYSGDEVFREAAHKAVEKMDTRLKEHVGLDHHDIGFLYSLSSKAQWILEKDEKAKQMTIQAADVLLNRWRPKSQIIQAWGPKDDPNNGGRMIIDCLLNLPLLFWAHQQTGKEEYYQVAVTHAEKSRRYLVRGDDSSYHTFYFDQETGVPIRGGTHQGYHDGSTWARGQAWGIYGFALAYRYTNKPYYLNTAKRMAFYFIDNLPEDYVSYWDFSEPVTEKTPRDSSGAAIAVCGMLELLLLLPEQDSVRKILEKAVQRIVSSLEANYASKDPKVEGFIEHGSYNVNKGRAPDDCLIWGDYFYLEALMRMEKGFVGYWYE
jgi:unsaturated chondroitin disaccharide hydrolase